MSASDHPPGPRRRWAAAGRSTRRALLRRRRLLAALCVGVAVFAALRVLSPAQEPTVDLLVAAHDLEAGSVLGEEDLERVAWPADTAPGGLASYSEVLGRTVTGPMRAGEPVTDVRLVSASLLEGHQDLEAVPVRIPDADVVGLLRVGDRIDLLATDPRSGDTQRVGEALPILALPEGDTGARAHEAQGALVVVGTTSQMSENVASASATLHLTALFSR